MIKLAQAQARERLEAAGHAVDLLERGSLRVQLLRPDASERSLRQDTIYLVQSGAGELVCRGQTESCAAGDLLLVPALAPHAFAGVDADLCVWALSLGPVGGEEGSFAEEE